MFEVACGNCQGRLLVQQTGIVVACPHCGTHLTIGGPVPAPTPQPPAFVPQPAPTPPPQPAWAPPPQPAPTPAPQFAATQQFIAPPPPAVQPTITHPAPAAEPQAAVPQFQAPPTSIVPEPAPAAPEWLSQPAAEQPPGTVGETMPFLGDFQAPHPAADGPISTNPAQAFDAAAVVAPAPTVLTPTIPAPVVTESFTAPAIPSTTIVAAESAAAPTVVSVPAPAMQPPQPQWAAAPTPVEPSAPAPVAYAQAPVAAYPQPEMQAVPPQAVQPTPQFAMQPAYAAQPAAIPQQPQQANWYPGAEQPAAAYPQQSAYGVPDAQSATLQTADPGMTDWSMTSSQPGTTAPAPRPIAPPGVSRGKFMLLANYASIATILAAFFAYKAFNSNTASGNDPANLPDVEPVKVGNKIGAVVVEPFHDVGASQKLTLGETKRFGNLMVTPLSVKRGEIEFERLPGMASGLQKPAENVLMLHVRFENVSENQDIAPLRSLAYKQQGTAFVCAESQRTKKGLKLHHAKLDKEAWKVKEHNIDKTIKPGETLETFIPTASKDVDKLLEDEGEKVWRLWFRKGYSRNNYGVTTLIDIAFSNSDIQSGA